MTKKNLTATALKYSEQDDAPSVSARGDLLLAKEMKSIARRYGVRICTDEKLADNLKHVETAHPIPSHLYFDVAKTFIKK